jgi:ABC-type branched-subunit amino acid transport system substrate-binding protein
MEKIRILLLRPEGDGASPADQSLGARLSAGPDVVIEEERFRPDDAGDLERKLLPCAGKFAGVVGATSMPESTRLGELAEQMNLLCFVANNNPSVWQKRRYIFHIGFPTSQTTAAVAALAQRPNLKRFLLLHDHNEFQRRVASSMVAILRARGRDVRSQMHAPQDALEIADGWKPELIYVVFSSERKALPIVRAIRNYSAEIPLVLGRSLLRASFLVSLGDQMGEVWFVDTKFRHTATRTEYQQHFTQVMAANGIEVPTTNHAFGWDGMRFCSLALKAAGGNPSRAIDYLESGIDLDGASGACCFSPENHNGRLGPGPTILTRWANRRLEQVQTGA